MSRLFFADMLRLAACFALLVMLGCSRGAKTPVVSQNDGEGRPKRNATESSAKEPDPKNLREAPTADEGGQQPRSKEGMKLDDATEKNSPADSQVAAESEQSDPNTGEVEKTDSQVVTPHQPPAPPKPSVPSERFVLFAPDGPILVDIAMTIDGRPYNQAMEAYLDDVLKAADENGDGRSTWQEVSTSRRFIYGQFGNAPVNNEAEAAELIRLYDADRDGEVDRSEVPRFVTRNAGGGRAFSMRNSNYHRGRNRRDSPLLKLLNQDSERALSADEMRRVVEQLRRRDADDDDLLYRTDFAVQTAMQNPNMEQMSNLRDSQLPATAVAFNSFTKWGTIQYWMSDLYAFGGEIEADSFPHGADLFQHLDENNNGRVETKETSRMLSAGAHIRLAANFGMNEPGGKPDSRIDLVELAPSLGGDDCVMLRRQNRVTLALPTIRLEFFINDQATADLSAQAKSTIEMYDANKDGYLTEDESPEENLGPVGRFEGVDADADGKVFAAEVEAFLRQQQGAVRTQIRARAADQEDAVFTVLDADGDGRLDSREISTAAQTLQSFDRNKDGKLSVNELPASMAIGFVRGNAQQNNALFTSPGAPAAKPSDSLPGWFVKMDANGDGEVSATEFLGPLTLFNKLDQNQDGFFEAGEATAFTQSKNPQDEIQKPEQVPVAKSESDQRPPSE